MTAWNELLLAAALMLVLEGILPFLNPAGLRRLLLACAELSDEQLRIAGLTSMIIGVILLYLLR